MPSPDGGQSGAAQLGEAVRTGGLTLVQVVLLHGADEVRSGVEVVWPRLLEAPQAEEAPLAAGAAGEGPAAGDAGVARPAARLQIEGLQRRHGHLPLAATCRGSSSGCESEPGNRLLTLVETQLLFLKKVDAGMQTCTGKELKLWACNRALQQGAPLPQ